MLLSATLTDMLAHLTKGSIAMAHAVGPDGINLVIPEISKGDWLLKGKQDLGSQ